VLGAGPVGLAAAAHLLERGMDPLILEASDEVAASVRDWGHVRLFSPWRFNVDKAARQLLEAWTRSATRAARTRRSSSAPSTPRGRARTSRPAP
jgi:2-polyprenyl-6-methoxyphenol hydroxylase-like FAD-dependent oxidoreductase